MNASSFSTNAFDERERIRESANKRQNSVWALGKQLLWLWCQLGALCGQRIGRHVDPICTQLCSAPSCLANAAFKVTTDCQRWLERIRQTHLHPFMCTFMSCQSHVKGHGHQSWLDRVLIDTVRNFSHALQSCRCGLMVSTFSCRFLGPEFDSWSSTEKWRFSSNTR